MEQITALDYKIQEMARRIRELREIEQLTVREMAKKTGVSESEYLACEKGESDFHYAGSLCHGWSAVPIRYLMQ